MSVIPSRLSSGVFRYFLAIVLITPALANELKDSGLQLSNPLVKVIYWADEQRVVASIFEKEPWIAPDGTKKGVESIFIWNVETNELKRHAGPGTGGLCVGDGFIRYFQRRLSEGKYDELDRYYGAIGKEQIHVLTGPIDQQTCRLESELIPLPAWLDAAKESGRIFKPLKPGHGWLEMDRGLPPAYPIAIHPPGKNHQPIPIDRRVLQPWLAQGYHVVFLRYEAFKDAYLLGLDDTRGAGDNKTGKLWWLYSDGRLEEILSYGREGNWKTIRVNGLIPARSSLLAIGTETNWPLDKSGLYRQTARGDLDLLAKGWVAGKVLSPDGCKIAFGIDPRGFWVKGPHTFNLQILDICPPAK